MKNFPKNLEDATEEELYSWVNHLDFRVVHLASDELTRRAIKQLKKSVDEGASQADKTSETQERYSKVLFLLTTMQVLVALFQFLLQFYDDLSVKAASFVIFIILGIIVLFLYFSNKIFSTKI